MENENNKSSYEPIGIVSSKSKKQDFNFTKQVLIPFVSGIVGATLVVGVSFGIPNIKENLVESDKYTINSSNTDMPSSTSLISLTNYSDTSINVAKKVLPSVVGIKVEYSVSSIYYRNINSSATAEGSGIIISEDGYILTNNHIVNSTSNSSYYELGKANKVTVTLYNDDTEYDGTIIGTDEETDLAVIKIDKDGLIKAELGDSDSIQVGEFVMAVGNPLGMQSSVSSGIVSAINRKITTEGKTYTLIQTDSAINSGNSGGALVNSDGKVIGINQLKISGSDVEGMGFAIPINSANPIYEQLIQYNKVKRPYIGINGRDLDENLAKANNLEIGIYILSIDEFSAAEKAGLKIGDVITAIDGKSISTMDELNEIKNTHSIGDEITLTIYRKQDKKEIKVVLEEQ